MFAEFDNLVRKAAVDNGYDGVYVERVHNEFLPDVLIRYGYSRVNISGFQEYNYWFGVRSDEMTDTLAWRGDALFMLKSPDGLPTLAEAAQKLGITSSDLDESFGVILTNPAEHLYTVLVKGSIVSCVIADRLFIWGPFLNPGIGTSGPPE